MPKLRFSLTTLALVLASLPAFALSENRMETYIVDEGKHPGAYQHAMVIPNDSEGDVYVCFGYANDGKRGNEGSFRGLATVSRMDPDTEDVTIERLRKRGNLKDNKWLRCVHTGPVRAGDTVVFDYTLSSFPKIRGATLHFRSAVGTDRMLITELRGAEARGEVGDPTEFHHRLRTNVSKSGKHPKAWQQAYVVAATSAAETLQMCFGYGNDFNKSNKGSFEAVTEIARTDPDTEEVTVQRFTTKADVKDNKAKRCREIGPVNMGDSVVTDFSFKSMPKVRGDVFQIKSSIGPVVMADREIYGPTVEDLPDELPPGSNPTPNPGGAISGKDQVAASSVLIATKRSQLWRFKGNVPKRWTVIGPKTKLGSGPGGVNPNTVGYGDTIAQAHADYQRKQGGLAQGGALSVADIKSLEWYQQMNAAAGPTSIRRDAGGGYHGEYFRPGRGAVHQSGFGGITAVVNWFKSQGL